jgi:hypothetical protein
MSGTPIRGFAGTITIGASDTPVGWISSWEVSVENDNQTIGPFINDGGAMYTYNTAVSLNGSFDGVVPSGKNAGQTLLVTNATGSTYVKLVLTTTGGYTITVPSGLITSLTLGQDAGETTSISADFMANGNFTIA